MQVFTCWLLHTQARKVPVCCPNPGCDEELSDADVANLLMDQPQLLQVCWDPHMLLFRYTCRQII